MGEAVDKVLGLSRSRFMARVGSHTRTVEGREVRVSAYWRSLRNMSLTELMDERDELKDTTDLTEKHRLRQVVNEIRYRSRFPDAQPDRQPRDILARGSQDHGVELLKPPQFMDYTDGDLRKALNDKLEEFTWHDEDDLDFTKRKADLQEILQEDVRRARDGRASIVWGIDPQDFPSTLPPGFFTDAYDEIYSRHGDEDIDAEIAAWEAYQDEHHAWMNAALRKGTTEELSETGAWQLKYMERAWQRHSQPLEEDLIAWRYMPEVQGAGGAVTWSPGNFFRPGTTIRDKGYVSVTAKRDDKLQWTFGAWTMMIRVPRGSNVMAGHAAERELILGKDGIFEVVRVDGETQQIEAVFRGYSE